MFPVLTKRIFSRCAASRRALAEASRRDTASAVVICPPPPGGPEEDLPKSSEDALVRLALSPPLLLLLLLLLLLRGEALAPCCCLPTGGRPGVEYAEMIASRSSSISASVAPPLGVVNCCCCLALLPLEGTGRRGGEIRAAPGAEGAAAASAAVG